ncbi:MAG: hypothetical protein JSS49_29135 [Planctomycetes bacterium]|nr:hypothetical protein [Planctomycetota bacterium]
MLLEGRPERLFSSRIELRLNGTSLGVIRHRWFSEGLDLDLGGNAVRFERVSWLKSHFVLKDADGNELGSAKPSGFFKRGWDLDLKSGPGHLQRAGWLSFGMELKQGTEITARVGRVGWFSRAWEVVASDSLPPEDLLLIGLVYITIRQREAQQNSA